MKRFNYKFLLTKLTLVALGAFSYQASALNLSCETLGENTCYGSGTNTTCFQDIKIRSTESGALHLEYRSQPLHQEIYALPTVVTDMDRGMRTQLAPGYPGLVASWDMGEHYVELLQTVTDDYVGTVSLEQDFPLTVHCHIMH